MIAGKGHEEQQIYKNKILNISDKKIVKKYKKELTEAGLLLVNVSDDPVQVFSDPRIYKKNHE